MDLRIDLVPVFEKGYPFVVRIPEEKLTCTLRKHDDDPMLLLLDVEVSDHRNLPRSAGDFEPLRSSLMFEITRDEYRIRIESVLDVLPHRHPTKRLSNRNFRNISFKLSIPDPHRVRIPVIHQIPW